MIIVISAGDMRCGLCSQGRSDQGYDDGFGPKAKVFPDLSYLIFDLRYSWYILWLRQQYYWPCPAVQKAFIETRDGLSMAAMCPNINAPRRVSLRIHIWRMIGACRTLSRALTWPAKMPVSGMGSCMCIVIRGIGPINASLTRQESQRSSIVSSSNQDVAHFVDFMSLTLKRWRKTVILRPDESTESHY